jgi:PD-(D/E)XK nuclease superfamily
MARRYRLVIVGPERRHIRASLEDLQTYFLTMPDPGVESDRPRADEVILEHQAKRGAPWHMTRGERLVPNAWWQRRYQRHPETRRREASRVGSVSRRIQPAADCHDGELVATRPSLLVQAAPVLYHGTRPMNAPLYTASEIDRLMQCHGSAALHQVKTSSQAGQLGSARHAQYLKPGALPRNCRLWLCGGNPANAPQDSQNRFEAAFEYEPRTGIGRYLGSNLARDYVLSGPGLSSGTLDVWHWWIDWQGLHIRVADLKTGFMQIAGDLPDPADSWQLRWYVLAALASLSGRFSPEVEEVLGGHESVKVASIQVAWFLPDELGCVEVVEAPAFTLADLETFRLSLADLSDRIEKQAGSIWREGPWCGRCPGFAICPVKRGTVDQLGLALEGPINERTIVSIHRLAQSAKKLAESGEDMCRQWLAGNGQLPTKPGYALGLQITRRRSLAPDAIERATGVLPTVPIKKTLDLSAFNDLPADEYRATMIKLLEAGAISVSTSTSIREMRVKP